MQKKKFFNSYNGLKDRPDYDGYLTKEEADTWWKEKSGEPLYVDKAKLIYLVLTHYYSTMKKVFLFIKILFGD